MRAGKAFGVQLVLNNWFLALVLIFVYVGLGAKVIGVFLAILWHELAHVITAAKLGFTVREIELLPFGGVARIEHINEASSKSEIIMAAAGPIASLVMAAVIYISKQELVAWGANLDFYYQVNLMLACFNILPCLPLDGGRILRAWLAMHIDYSKATRAVGRLGKIFCAILLGLAVIQYWFQATINLTVIVAAGFLYVAAKTELAVAGFRLMHIMARKKEALSARGIMPAVELSVTKNAVIRDIVKFFKPGEYYILLVLDKDFKIKGMITETQLWEALPTYGLCATIDEFL
ncbi:MAG: spoIVFB [Firmicutes bacterium]|nr:spoIVFB [Bacillota bacterium]